MRPHIFHYLSLVVLLNHCEQVPPDSVADFEITIENISGSEAAPAAMLGAGIYYKQHFGSPLFFNRAFDYGDGLEQLAEDGNPDSLVLTLGNRSEIVEYASFGNLAPGGSVTLQLQGEYGNRINFATMFMESNDLFYAFNDEGISLFEPNGDPVSGDFTHKVLFWDTGTEENEPPYEGQFQPPRQSFPGEGVSTPLEAVRPRDDDFDYPAIANVIRVTITSRQR